MKKIFMNKKYKIKNLKSKNKEKILKKFFKFY